MAWAGPAADEEEEKSRPLPEGESTGQEYVGQHARDDDSDVHQKLRRGGGRGERRRRWCGRCRITWNMFASNIFKLLKVRLLYNAYMSAGAIMR